MNKAENRVKWQEPPPKHEPKYDWASIAAKLRKKPGEWALIYEQDRTSLSVAIKIGSIKELHPDLGFEVRTAHNKRPEGQPRVCDMYLRYVPKEND